MKENVINNNENYSQSKQILDYLQAGNALTLLEVLRKFNCLRLGARIYDLRQQGYVINSLIIKDDILGKRYARYSLVSLN
ncbi:helix-turn-helix domain-containing protein [Snodgrassella sp. W8158]|uniref:helix-turn-helix domain-containing protein n=1 Tax=Snodgrassella sp. W8158 TaxID=2751018 RepID=UPI00351C1C3D|nr:helix-turn-helix domain-containing protein [Snodgrassella sp. W8158]